MRKIGKYAMTVQGLPSRDINAIKLQSDKQPDGEPRKLGSIKWQEKPCWNKVLNGAVDCAGGFENEKGSIINWSLLVINMACNGKAVRY